MKSIHILFFLLLSFCCNAQVWKTIDKTEFERILKPTVDLLSSKEYSYHVNYKSFIGHESEILADEMNGISTRSGSTYYYNMPGNLSVQDSKIRLQIDTAEKMIVLMPTDEKIDKSVSESLYNEHISKATSIEYTNEANKVIVRLMFPKWHDWEEQRFYIDSSGLLEKTIIFYRAALPVENEDENSVKEKARLEIKYSGWKNSSAIPARWQVASIVAPNGKSFLPLGRFAGYQVIDFR